AMKSARMCIVAGCRATAARPVARVRPYRRRRPPARLGWQRTGRPATMFWMNTSLGSTPESSVTSSGPAFFFSMYASMNSQPSIRNFRTCFWIFGGLEAHPIRDDEARAATNPVRLDSGQVSEAADLRVLRPFAVDRYGAIRDDERDLLVGGGVLEV